MWTSNMIIIASKPCLQLQSLFITEKFILFLSIKLICTATTNREAMSSMVKFRLHHSNDEVLEFTTKYRAP